MIFCVNFAILSLILLLNINMHIYVNEFTMDILFQTRDANTSGSLSLTSG